MTHQVIKKKMYEIGLTKTKVQNNKSYNKP